MSSHCRSGGGGTQVRAGAGMRFCCGLAMLAATLLGPSQASATAGNEMIWPRITAGMRLVDGEQPETVIWARHYARQPGQFEQMLARAEPFLWYIVEAVELRELPLEIALVPAVESNFNPNARSPQKARGLWQFIPRTGRALGLRETAHHDAKRDAVESTRAALTYLLKLHRRFNQDWLLTLAAYNVGERALAQAIGKAGSNNFWDLDLPAETREHVPRLLGIALLIQQPGRFGVKLPPIRNRNAAEMIALQKPRDLERAARRASVDAETIERYNPGLKTLANTQGKRWLLLPANEAQRLRAELARREYKPRKAPSPKQHVVASGESLWRIARRYQVSVTDLREWNGLRQSAVLKPGSKLLIRQTG